MHEVHVGPVDQIEPVIFHESHGKREAIDDESHQRGVLHGLLEPGGRKDLDDAVQTAFFVDGQTAPCPERAGKGSLHGNDA